MRYPMHFYRGFFTMFLLGALLGTAMIVIDYGFNLRPLGLVLAYAGAALCAFGFQFLLSRLSFVEVSPDGIAGSTFWGRRGFVRWNQIRSARRYYLFPMGVIWVRASDNSPALWLPTHVNRQRNLAEHLRNFAPTGNPLLVCFGP